ncbi:ATP-binding protein [Pelosinus sp. sgz500959]|uniref:hybrid sensor histidine kinase/response regulator n=1 Tax=Pelosinus sp. sgz500959 TaxID=3242472 RepID=UPI00366FF72C
MMLMPKKRKMPYLVVLLSVILLILGWISYGAVNTVANLTANLYDHPYTVSTAVLRINANILSMHLVMNDLLRATTPEEIKTYKTILNQTENKVLTDFQLVEGRFLGEPQMVQEALQAFLNWKIVREEIISLVIQEKKLEAVALIQNTENQQIEEMENKINVLLDFANNKANIFHSEAQETRSRTLQILLLSFGISLFLAAIIFHKAVRLEGNLQEANEQLENKVAERTKELSASNEEIKSMNEELIVMNEKLEIRVEERTSELMASYQELQATDEELRAQFENLRATQEALYHEKLLTDALFDSVPGMLYLYDDQGKLVRWNKRHEKMTGYSPDELSGMDILAWYKGDEETTTHITNKIQRALKEGFADIEADLQRKDGTKLVAYLTAVPLKIDGKMHFAGIGIDIAERKKAVEEMVAALKKAEKANLAKSQFLANMSHEIRTPMNGIIGMTDLTLMTDLEEQQREYLTIVKTSTLSLLRVLNDILDYSKIEAGKIELEKGLFDLTETMNEVIDLFDIGAKQKELLLTLKIDERVPKRIIGDSVRLRQVVSNLVGNGIKFTYEGEICINVDVIEQYEKQIKLRFIVTDTGIGIPEDKLDKLFKRFSQVDDSNTRQFGGTGLGLAISKKLIEIMDGEIGVESKENLGSTFFFTAVFELPKEEIKEIKKDSTDNQPIPYDNEDIKKVLLAEDDMVSRNMVTIMLKQKGFEVTAVENGIEAVSAFEKNKFNVILMDVNMPYMDGYSATATIRSKEKQMNYRTPIIAMTAYALKGDREKCLEVGMDDYISKPISLTQTMDMIGKYVGKITSQNIVK